jgi:hypothetical protein
MIEPGRYDAKAIEAQLAQAGTGTPQVAVLFEIEDGRTITWFGFLTEKSFPYTLKALRILGFKGGDISKVESQELGEASITVKHDTYEGETRAKVEWVNEPGSSGPALTPLENKSAFAKAMAKKIAALEAGGKSEEEDLDEVLDDDDVPFDV